MSRFTGRWQAIDDATRKALHGYLLDDEEMQDQAEIELELAYRMPIQDISEEKKRELDKKIAEALNCRENN